MIDYIGAILNILGNPSAIVPIGVPVGAIAGGVAGENVARTTVTTKGLGAGDGLVFTYSSARPTWVGPQFYKGRGRALNLKFAGPTDYLETPDADFWTFLTGVGDDGPFSWGATVNIVDQVTDAYLFNKYDTGGEYRFLIDSNEKLYVGITSATVEVSRQSSSALPKGRNVNIGFTYDGSGGAAAMNGALLYADGVVLASAATNNALYTSMVNTTDKVAIGRRSNQASGGYINSLISAPGMWVAKKQLSAAEMQQVHLIGLDMQKNRRLYSHKFGGI